MTDNNKENDNHFDKNQDIGKDFKQKSINKNIFIKIIKWCKRNAFCTLA